MIPYVRRQKILEMLALKDVVYLDEIVEKTEVSAPTIRRDLKALEEEGLVDLLKGGAVKIVERVRDKSVEQRLEINQTEKEIICRTASQFINQGDTVYLGPGTTENFLIKHLNANRVSVVTNGIFHANKLSEYNIKTNILGGNLLPKIGATIGIDTIETINGIHFDVCFVGASAVSLESGVMTVSDEIAGILKLIIKRSKKLYLLVDSSKFDEEAAYTFAQLDDFTKIITTNHIDKKYLELPNIFLVDEEE